MADDFTDVELPLEERDERTAEIELHHAHLPSLDNGGFIDWDEQTGEIRKGENFEQIRPLLELMDRHRDELPQDWP